MSDLQNPLFHLAQKQAEGNCRERDVPLGNGKGLLGISSFQKNPAPRQLLIVQDISQNASS